MASKKAIRTFKPVDMTTGTPWKKILIFTIPMLIGNIAQQLYNAVDSVVVGHYIGDNALAAVGSAAPIVNLLVVLFVGVATGASIMVSQYLGARNREALSATIGNCVILTVGAAIAVTVLGCALSRPMLRYLSTPESILDWCDIYLKIMFAGAIGGALYNILSGVLRGLGDSVSALVYLAVASVLNIVLDIFFVAQLKMGVEGVALATEIAQGLSGILCIRRLAQMSDMFDFRLKYIRWDKKYGMQILKLGLPSGITQAIFSMSSILVQSLTNSFGEMFIAANVIVMRVDGFAMLPNFSFGTAMTTFAGQNIGAGDRERTERGSRQGLLMSVLISSAITGLILLFGRYLMGIFTTTEELVDLSMRMMRILAVGYIAMAVIQSLGGVMRGAGDTLTPMWVSIIQQVIRVVLAYLLVNLTKSPELPEGRASMLFVSLLVSWLIGCLMSAFVYRMGKWRRTGFGTD